MECVDWRRELGVNTMLSLTDQRHFGLWAGIFVIAIRGVALASLVAAVRQTSPARLMLGALELAFLLLGMMWVGSRETNPHRIQIGASMVICGVMLNRLNPSITALESTAGEYGPHWIEVLIAFSLVAASIAGFAVCARHLPVFEEDELIHRR